MSAAARRYYRRGCDALEQGELETARADFAAAVELVPRFVEARVACAAALVKGGQAQAGAQLLRAGLGPETRPRSLLMLEAALAEALLATADYRGAEAALERVRALVSQLGLPGDRMLALDDRLARLRAKTGRFPEAFDALLRAARSSG